MLAIAILAAGKGTRMRSSLPKVLQPLAGKTLLERVLSSCDQLEPQKCLIIIGHEANKIKQKLSYKDKIDFVLQEPQNGTGHAIQQLLKVLKDFDGELIVLNGDVPLLQPETIKRLLEAHRSSNADATLLTARFSDPSGYGRVFIDKQGQISKIIEECDCDAKQRKNNLTNSGVYCFNWNKLNKVLPELESDNAQGELYLTDTIRLLDKAIHIEIENQEEVKGINNRIQMAECEALIQQKLQNYWLQEGVTFIDPRSCTLSEDCSFGKDVIIEPQTHFKGSCKIGDRCHLGPGSLLEDVEIGNDVQVIYSVINSTKIANRVSVGPFANLRPESKVSNDCKIGNFVELKKSTIGEGSKVNHLSYIGDSELGQRVNIGAGTITANFDGFEKHKTVIGDYSKTGANCVLVAPINLGKEVTVGAGSTLTKDVPSGSLAIGRAKQLTKQGWSIKKPG